MVSSILLAKLSCLHCSPARFTAVMDSWPLPLSNVSDGKHLADWYLMFSVSYHQSWHLSSALTQSFHQPPLMFQDHFPPVTFPSTAPLNSSTDASYLLSQVANLSKGCGEFSDDNVSSWSSHFGVISCWLSDGCWYWMKPALSSPKGHRELVSTGTHQSLIFSTRIKQMLIYSLSVCH